MRTGILVFAHGSRLEPANEAVRVVARQVAERVAPIKVEAAFLELGTPSLVDAAVAMADEGIARVIVTPYFLTPGMHLDRDLPKLVREILEVRPQLAVQTTASLDGHPALADILLARVLPELQD
jgi:sirohydrochlorin ferrochelatase